MLDIQIKVVDILKYINDNVHFFFFGNTILKKEPMQDGLGDGKSRTNQVFEQIEPQNIVSPPQYICFV